MDIIDNNEMQSRRELVESVFPFCFLSEKLRQNLVEQLVRRDFPAQALIFRQHDAADQQIFLLFSGKVELYRIEKKTRRRTALINEFQYFGERSALFHIKRQTSARAFTDCICYSLQPDLFFKLLQESRSFALFIGNTLREKQGVFRAFDRFNAELLRYMNRGYIEISRLMTLYTALEPAIHAQADMEASIDFYALSYAIKRLPENVTRSFAFILADELPPVFSAADSLFSQIPTSARRRRIYELLPGENMVLLRYGMSDVVDLITCLCLYGIEIRKIRERLNDQHALLLISGFLQEARLETGNGGKSADALLKKLRFSDAEIAGLKLVWPQDPVNRLNQIICHREFFSVQVRRQRDDYSTRSTEIWTSHITEAVVDLLGIYPNSFGDDIHVHIISSNTHSVMNCLNPFFQENKQMFLDWAAEKNHPFLQKKWHSPDDLLYALFKDYRKEFPSCLANYSEEGEPYFYSVNENISTGIQVQLINLSALDDKKIDPGISRVKLGKKVLLVNIDYAFGEQAGEIIRNLLILFGHSIKSIDVLGKAGALLGNRGDILIPDAFIEQATDFFQPLKKMTDKELHRLKERAGDRSVYRGGMLTVAGTLLQNRTMLYFYKHLWDCIGLEMEGSHYHHYIQKAMQLKLIPRNIPVRYFYYVSDLPLDPAQSLAAPMDASEGIPPLYAITREILSQIYSHERTV